MISGLQNVSEEIIGSEELESRIDAGQSLNHYIGFEISGLVHLGTGIMTGLVVRELQKLGVNTSFWLADWHTWINNKLDGDREFINRVAKEYFDPALRISAAIAGADPDKIVSRTGSEIYHNNDKFWESFMEISKNLTLARVMKSITIAGRKETDSTQFAILMYPSLQAADIFELKAHIAHAGTDQRKIHVIAREVAEHLNINPLLDDKGNKMKPMAIHHHLLLGLQTPTQWPLPEGEEKDSIRTQMKMSKSIKGSAIFIHDSPDEIKQKMRSAFCPEKEVDYNPVLDWVKHMVFPIAGSLEIKRDEKFGGNFTATDYQEIQDRFASGDLHPLDLKSAVSEFLIKILEPARELFGTPSAQQLIEEIKQKQTR